MRQIIGSLSIVYWQYLQNWMLEQGYVMFATTMSVMKMAPPGVIWERMGLLAKGHLIRLRVDVVASLNGQIIHSREG